MPLKVTPEEGAEKWGRRLSGATEDIRRGVQRVTQAPGAKAAQTADKWLQNVSASRDRFARNSAAVTLQQWQDATIGKGVSRISSGVQGAKDKVTAAYQTWYPLISAAADSVNAMPNVTIDDAIARASAFIRKMHDSKVGQGRR